MIYYVIVGEKSRFFEHSGNALGIIHNNHLDKDINTGIFVDPFCFWTGYALSPEEIGLIEPYPNQTQIKLEDDKLYTIRKKYGTKPDNHQFNTARARNGIMQNGNKWQEGIIPTQTAQFEGAIVHTHESHIMTSIQGLKERGILK